MTDKTYDPATFESQLQRFPVSVVTEFRGAEEAARKHLGADDYQAWAAEGVSLAQHTFRSWEAATEYFKSTPRVVQALDFPEVMEWARWGRALSSDSPVISSSFFRATPEVIPYVRGSELGRWAGVGKRLYKGTWKSSSLASTYFEASPRLLGALTLEELEDLVDFIDSLAQKSYDLANECLALASGVFPKIDPGDRVSFLNLGSVLVRGNWRDVKPYFENGPKIIERVEPGQRGRFLNLAQQLSQQGAGNTITFLVEASAALGEVHPDWHGPLLDMADRLADHSAAAVGEFVKNAPVVMNRLHGERLEGWFNAGLRVLDENEDGGLAFFRLESGRAERAIEDLSSGLDLTRVNEVLTMYCRALAGQRVELRPTDELQGKGIGWTSSDYATTEGDNIFLPGFVERYTTKDENFAWFKVIATHQVGHLEFGSFGFEFDKPSTVFAAEEQRTVLGKRDGDGGARIDLERFFDLFSDRRLASDIFMLVEDGRIDHRVKYEYAGIGESYRRVQRESLRSRPEPDSLPLREAAMEVLVRLSLEEEGAVKTPAEISEHLDALAVLVRTMQHEERTVEDTAEATIRIYDLLSTVPNVEADPEGGEERSMDEMGQDADEGDVDQMLQDLMEGASGEGQPDGEEQEYKSPQMVEFRGEFKPELVQAFDNLKNERSKAQNPMEITGLSEEDLRQLLEKSAEIEVAEAQEGDLPQSSSQFVDNLINEAARQQQAKSKQGTQFQHSEDDDAPLAGEAETFLYDEWDFRAGDYKPRWCAVREKRMDEGTVDFFERTLRAHYGLVSRIKKQFESLAPEQLRRVKHLPDGEEYDFDLVVEAMIQARAGDTPTDKIYWRRNKIERDVAVSFLLDMSASTAEAVDETRRQFDSWDFPDDPRDYMTWLRTRREEMSRRTYKRIIDIEKESTVLLIKALEAIGDQYGIYGFSGYGRENVEFYVVKDIAETFGENVKRRLDKITPMHATRMGPAIRHAVSKLDDHEARTKVLFLLSDGRPQDRGYSREGVEKEYAVHDTRMALLEARRLGITPFCLTVDRAGHDYLKTMMGGDMGYEVVADIHTLPERLPQLYRRLTV